MKISPNIKIGFIVVVILAFTYWGINFLKGKDIFNTQDTYVIIYEKIDGLTVSSPVLLRGYKVGQVQDIRFTNSRHESLTVEIAIQKTINLPKNTTAHIFSSDLMGTKSIDLLLGASDTLAKQGDTLQPKVEESLSDQVKLQMLPLKKKAEDLIASVETAIVAVKNVFNKKTGQELTRSLQKIQLAIDAIQRSSSNLDTILTDGQSKIKNILTNIESISGNIKNNNKNISTILNNVGTFSDSLSKSNIASTINNAEKSLAEFEKIISALNNGHGTLGKLFQNDTLYYNLENVTANLDSLIIDVNENPKKYVHFSLFGSSK